MQYYGLDWFATICGLTGAFLLGNKNKYGFLTYMLASASWIGFAILAGSYALALGASILLLVHFRGWLRWQRG